METLREHLLQYKNEITASSLEAEKQIRPDKRLRIQYVKTELEAEKQIRHWKNFLLPSKPLKTSSGF